MNRKGFEKPIEVFVALFIIMAVALVAMRLSQDRIAAADAETAALRATQRSHALLSDLQLSCSQKCVSASNNGCSLTGLASLCMHNSRNVLASPIDLNNNGLQDYDKTLLAGVGLCEERIYCFHLMDTCCAQEISAESCKEILRSYWESKGVATAATFDATYDELVPGMDPGSSCQPDGDYWRQ